MLVVVVPRYLVTYTDREGTPKTCREEAPSARELAFRLHAEGIQDVQFHDDDISAQAKDVEPWRRNLASPRQEYEHESRPAARTPVFWWSWGTAAACLGCWLLWWGARQPGPLLFLVGLAGGGAVIYTSAASFAMAVFGALRRAKTWHRWDEFEKHIVRLERLNRFLGIKIVAHELVLYRAVLLSARGRFDEALERFESLQASTGWDRSTYLARLSDLYAVRHDTHGELERLQEAYEASGPDSPVYIDYARALAAAERPDEAERVLGSREPVAMTLPARVFIGWAGALVSLARGHHLDAARCFEDLIRQVDAIYDPAVWEGPRLDMQAHLGIALALAGDDARARAELEAAISYVRAAGHPHLLARCEKALEGRAR